MAGVRGAFFAPNTLASLYNAKDVLLKESVKESTTHTVYSVRCMPCGEEDVGKTLRALSFRRKEHKGTIRSGHSSKSAIPAEHVHNQSKPHEIDWSTMRVLDRVRFTTESRDKEAMHIQKW